MTTDRMAIDNMRLWLVAARDNAIRRSEDDRRSEISRLMFAAISGAHEAALRVLNENDPGWEGPTAFVPAGLAEKLAALREDG